MLLCICIILYCTRAHHKSPYYTVLVYIIPFLQLSFIYILLFIFLLPPILPVAVILLNKPSNLLGNKIWNYLSNCGKRIENCHQLSPPISLRAEKKGTEIFIFIPPGLKTSSTWDDKADARQERV